MKLTILKNNIFMT